MGEFFMPGAELISQPVYAERRKKIEQVCYNAGEQVVKEGKITRNLWKLCQTRKLHQKNFRSRLITFGDP